MGVMMDSDAAKKFIENTLKIFQAVWTPTFVGLPCSAKRVCQLSDCGYFHNLKQTSCFGIEIFKAAHLTPWNSVPPCTAVSADCRGGSYASDGPDDVTATHENYVSCSSRIQIGFTFLVLPFWCRLTRVVPDKIHTAIKRLCVYVWPISTIFGAKNLLCKQSPMFACVACKF